MMLRSYKHSKSPFCLLIGKKPDALANDVVNKLAVSTPSVYTSVRKTFRMEMFRRYWNRKRNRFFYACSDGCVYPTRGLDINSSYLIYDLRNEQKKKTYRCHLCR